MKMKKLKRAIAFLLVFCAVAASSFSALAAEISQTIHIIVPVTPMKVTVPAAFPFDVAKNGTVTAPTNMSITNHSFTSVRITSITAVENGWTIKANGTELTNDSKEMSLGLNGYFFPVVNPQTGYSSLTAPRIIGVGIEPEAELALTPTAAFASQSHDYVDETVAYIVFTIDYVR